MDTVLGDFRGEVRLMIDRCNVLELKLELGLDEWKKPPVASFAVIPGLVSVVNRKDRASPCRQNFERSPLRNLASKVLIELMSQDWSPGGSELWIRWLFSIVNKDDDIFKSMWLYLFRRVLLEATMGYALLNPAYDVVVSAVIVLALVYQHLLGQVNGGGCRAYSSGSLDFRDTYISVLLFQGAFVWIWFRDVAPRKFYLREKTGKDGRVTYCKYETRFKPPRQKGAAGKVWAPSHLRLGSYITQQEAETVYDIASSYYDKGKYRLELGDGIYFPIPRMTERERGLLGKEKDDWVVAKTKEVFNDFKTAKAARSEVPEIDVGEQAVALDSWLPTKQVPCCPCVSPTLSTDEVSKFSLAVLEDSNMGGSGSVSLFEFAELGSNSQVTSGDLSLPASEMGCGIGTECVSVLDNQPAEQNCQEGIDNPAPILDRNDASMSDVNSEQEHGIEELQVIQKEYIEREVNRRFSEEQEQHRLRVQQLEEEIFKLKKENEQIPELKRKVEQSNSFVLEVQKVFQLHCPLI